MMRMVPGDPARQALGPEATGDEVARLHQEWGLDKPVPVQYAYWLGRVVHGDFGRSTVSRVPVTTEIWARFPNTLWLTIASMLVSVVIGLGSGVVAAVRHNSLIDRGSMVGGAAGRIDTVLLAWADANAALRREARLAAIVRQGRNLHESCQLLHWRPRAGNHRPRYSFDDARGTQRGFCANGACQRAW